MAEKSKYPRIEKSRYLYKDIPRALANRKLWWIFTPGLFLAGFVFAVVFSIFAGKYSMYFIIGTFAGFGLAFSFFPAIYNVMMTSTKIRFIDEIIKTAKDCEILYLHDSCFDGLRADQRLTMARNLTQSCNLDNYEVLADLALAKIKLHLSPDRIRDFLTLERLGETARITAEQLQVLESKNIIRPEAVRIAAAKRPDYHQDSAMINAHSDRIIEADWDAIGSKCSKIEKFAGILFLSAFVIIIVGFILSASVNNSLIFVAVSGFALAFCAPVLLGLASNRRKRIRRYEEIVDSVKRSQLLDIGDECFAGMTLSQRLTVATKLIDCKKLYGYELISDIAVAEKKQGYTIERAEKELEEHAQLFLMKKSNIIQIDIAKPNTNCDSCGAALKDGVKFCTHCGKKI